MKIYISTSIIRNYPLIAPISWSETSEEKFCFPVKQNHHQFQLHTAYIDSSCQDQSTFLINQLGCQYSRETLLSLGSFMESQECSGWEASFSVHQIQPSQDHPHTKRMNDPNEILMRVPVCQNLASGTVAVCWFLGPKPRQLVCLLQNAITDLRVSGSREKFACRQCSLLFSIKSIRILVFLVFLPCCLTFCSDKLG